MATYVSGVYLILEGTDPQVSGVAWAREITWVNELGAIRYVDCSGAIHYIYSGSGIGISDHTLLSNIGTNTHVDIDNHIVGTGADHTFIDQDVTKQAVPTHSGLILGATTTSRDWNVDAFLEFEDQTYGYNHSLFMMSGNYNFCNGNNIFYDGTNFRRIGGAPSILTTIANGVYNIEIAGPGAASGIVDSELSSRLYVSDTSSIFNDTSEAIAFIVRSLGNNNSIWVDGTLGNTGFGTSYPIQNIGRSNFDADNTGANVGIHVKNDRTANGISYVIIEGDGALANGEARGFGGARIILAASGTVDNDMMEIAGGGGVVAIRSLNDDGTLNSEGFRVAHSGNSAFGTDPNNERLRINGGVVLGEALASYEGSVQAVPGDIQGYVSGVWVSLVNSFVEATIDHNNILNNGTQTHAQIDAHLSSSGNIHFLEGEIDHDNIQNVGTVNHTSIDNFVNMSGINSLVQNKTITFIEPETGDTVPMWNAEENIRLIDYRYVLVKNVGVTTPEFDYQLKHGSDITSGTAVIVLSGVATSNGSAATTLGDDIPKSDQIWVEVEKASGVFTFSLQLRYLTHRF